LASGHDSLARASERTRLRYVSHGIAVEGTLEDVRLSADGSQARILPQAGKLFADKAIRYEKLLYPWVMQVVANACDVPLSTIVLAADGNVVLKPCTPDDARAQLEQWIEAWHHGMHEPLSIASRTAFAWLLAERAGKDPCSPARAAYEGSDIPQAPAGEVEYDAYLARDWQSFDALFTAGFERWLPLYRPLIDAAQPDDAP
jgi:exodeoxyribonuclease V gamma subunit